MVRLNTPIHGWIRINLWFAFIASIYGSHVFGPAQLVGGP